MKVFLSLTQFKMADLIGTVHSVGKLSPAKNSSKAERSIPFTLREERYQTELLYTFPHFYITIANHSRGPGTSNCTVLRTAEWQRNSHTSGYVLVERLSAVS
ncbi:unnamed protein product [Microthlaspi erraticum]|uniref:Uncharacterized protein n=1 Tax=Microthlaspi erraticum TaxID=1685480 RepID=A0A6D2IBM4_9BRAS|nr:unnamed protein product [Microthlaspi erraticum]